MNAHAQMSFRIPLTRVEFRRVPTYRRSLFDGAASENSRRRQPWPQRKSLPRTTVRYGSKVTSRSLIPEENPSGSPAGRKSRFAVAATPPTRPSVTVPTRSLGLPTKSTPAICLCRHHLRRNRNAEGSAPVREPAIEDSHEGLHRDDWGGIWPPDLSSHCAHA